MSAPARERTTDPRAAPSEEIELFRTSLRRALARSASVTHTRDVVEGRGGAPRRTWDEIDRMLGLRALPVPEELGGQGFGWAGSGIALEELGRTLYPAPHLAECVAARLLACCDTARADELRRSGAAGAVSIAAALGAADGPDPVTATHDPEGWTLSGRTAPALGLDAADVVLVPVAVDGRVHVFEVQAATADLTTVPTLDLTRPLATAVLGRTPARLLTGADATRAVENAVAFGATGLALEAIGGAARCLELAIQHVRDREQFGVVVGSLQGVKHLAADLLRELEPVRSAAYWALGSADSGGHEDFVEAASIAKLVADRMYPRVAVDCIQLHGALGFTWEYEINLHYKRAVTNRALFGESGYHRMVIARAVRKLAGSHD